MWGKNYCSHKAWALRVEWEFWSWKSFLNIFTSTSKLAALLAATTAPPVLDAATPWTHPTFTISSEPDLGPHLLCSSSLKSSHNMSILSSSSSSISSPPPAILPPLSTHEKLFLRGWSTGFDVDAKQPPSSSSSCCPLVLLVVGPSWQRVAEEACQRGGESMKRGKASETIGKLKSSVAMGWGGGMRMVGCWRWEGWGVVVLENFSSTAPTLVYNFSCLWEEARLGSHRVTTSLLDLARYALHIQKFFSIL